MRPKYISLSAAKSNFGRLFEEVRRGREVVVLRARRPVAVLRRIESAKSIRRS